MDGQKIGGNFDLDPHFQTESETGSVRSELFIKQYPNLDGSSRIRIQNSVYTRPSLDNLYEE